MKATHHPPTHDDDTGITPADLLRGAALYLTRHGWTTGQFFDLLANTDGPFPPACASGAIMTAATGHCLANGTNNAELGLYESPEGDDAIHAMRALAHHLDPEYDPWETSAIDVIGDWNDDQGRTLAEVIQTLTDAANDWQTAHPTGGAR